MYYIGVDIGGMSIKTGIVDESGKILTSSVIETEKIQPEKQIEKIANQIEKLIEDFNVKKCEIVGVGVGCPGAIDVRNGVVKSSSNLKWTEFPLKCLLEESLGLKVRVANDADCATLGEVLFGAGKGYSTAVMLTLGTGVGGGVVLNGKLYEGPFGMASELGHITLKMGGEPCGCGRSGCFEQYASASALIRISKEKMLENRSSKMWEYCQNDLDKVNGKTAFDCAKNGDFTANLVVDEYVKNLSEGMLNYCNIFRPELIIIGGGISKEGDYLISKVKSYMQKYNYGYLGSPKCEIIVAKLRNDAGIIGASALVME